MNIETPIQKLVENATLRHVSSEGTSHEFVIDPMLRKARTSFGRQTIIYTLRIDSSADEGGRFEIEEEPEMQGGEVLLSTDDASEVVVWIEENRP